MKRTMLRALVLVASLSGCLSKASAEFGSRKAFQGRTRPLEDVELYFRGQKMSGPYKEIAVIKGRPNNETVEQTLDAMKTVAGQRGLDGIREVICMDPSSVGAGSCTGMGFIYE